MKGIDTLLINLLPINLHNYRNGESPIKGIDTHTNQSVFLISPYTVEIAPLYL